MDMESICAVIGENVKRITDQMGDAAVQCGRRPEEIQLMAVTKTVPADRVNMAVHQGIQLLGENKAQELLQKYEDYHKQDTSIHFIGHLQSNKVRQIVDKVDMIHSVDSVKLAAEINRQAQSHDRVMDVLIEVNIGGERSKSGVMPGEVGALAVEMQFLGNVRLRGLMTIPPFDALPAQTESFFEQTRALLEKTQDQLGYKLDTLSMGMSGDFPAAIRQGATIVRIGTAIFGGRNEQALGSG